MRRWVGVGDLETSSQVCEEGEYKLFKILERHFKYLIRDFFMVFHCTFSDFNRICTWLISHNFCLKNSVS